MNATSKAEALKNSVNKYEHIFPYRFSEEDYANGAISKTRFEKDNVKCCYFLFANGAINPDNTKRNTFFEVYYNNSDVALVGCESVKKILDKQGIVDFKKQDKWDLKFLYSFPEGTNMTEIANFIMAEYERIYY